MTPLIILAAAIMVGLLLAWRQSKRPGHNPGPPPDLGTFERKQDSPSVTRWPHRPTVAKSAYWQMLTSGPDGPYQV